MACFVPFNNKILDISFFVFRPKVVLVDEFLDELKRFSSFAENQGCLQSSILRSIHGNMIIWYGGWLKMSCQDQDLLTKNLLSMLTNTSSMAVLIEYGFFEPYAGESKDESVSAKFSTGDIISMNAAASPSYSDFTDLSYAILALFKCRFIKMEGVNAGVCLKCQCMPRVACLYVWKSLHHCYSWILSSSDRKSMLPYLDRFSANITYDVFRVVHVGGETVWNIQCFSAHLKLENGGESKEREVYQN